MAMVLTFAFVRSVAGAGLSFFIPRLNECLNLIENIFSLSVDELA